MKFERRGFSSSVLKSVALILTLAISFEIVTWVPGAEQVNAEYTIDTALRFNQADSAYLSRTPAVAGNRHTWTFSAWVKRGTHMGASQNRFITSGSAGDEAFRFRSGDQLHIFFNGAASGSLISSAVFRDPARWMHIMVAVDTTQATDSNRVKIYVDGEQITDFSSATYPAQNYSTSINNNGATSVGTSGSEDFDGYMADVYFIDGQQLTPSSFGEEDANGYWRPKDYTGTYGTNGFHLDFSNSASLGADSSGNGNNFTPNNLDSTDQVVDTPSNAYATGNSIAPNGGTFSNGNLQNTGAATSTIELPTSGAWYWEVYASGSGANAGVISEDGVPHTTALTSGLTYGLLFDADTGNLYYTSSGSVLTELATGLPEGQFPYVYGGTTIVNYGQSPHATSTATALTFYQDSGGYFLYQPTTLGGAATRTILTSGTSWSVPDDWNNSNNSIEVIGGGGGGRSGLNGAAGGGGGAYSKAVNVTLTAGGTVTYAIGAGGAAETAGGDTYFCNSTSNCASISGTAVVTGAKGGAAGSTDLLGGVGGSSASGIGSVKFSGGTGGVGDTTSDSGGGGGGAAGPLGDGGDGGAGAPDDTESGGGGGNGGGSDGQQGDLASSETGGNGGNNAGGTGGGAGGDGAAGAAGTVGGGGGGGDDGFDGGAGGNGTEWTTAGSGGGGGAAANPDTGESDDGGNGGLYGGAGGGGEHGGVGGKGIIVITYTPNAGAAPSYKALSTENLPEISINRPSQYFDTKLYTGNGSTQSISGLLFQPALVWLKDRTDANDHGVFDAIRGATQFMASNAAVVEATDADTLTSFDSSGFSIGADTKFNTSANSYVSWNWKEDTTSGFDIVSYTGNGTDNRTIAHSLGVEPDFGIVRRRNCTGCHWFVWDRELPTGLVIRDTVSTNDAAVGGGVPDVVPGDTGTALNFKGAEYGLTSATPSTSVTNWTLAAWIKPATLPTAGFAVYNGNDTGGYGFGVADGIGLSGSKLQGLYGGVAWLDSGYTFPTADTWYHVVMARDSTTVKFYVDGVQTANTFTNTPGTVQNEFSIGMQLNSSDVVSRFFNGGIRDVRFYNRAISSTEAATLASGGSVTSGLIGHWPLDRLENNGYTMLNSTAAGSTSDTPWGRGQWDDTSIMVDTTTAAGNNGNISGGTYIAYLFAEKDGFSRFGSYTGNGSTSGPFVYTGFKPAFLMVKRTDSTGNWVVEDSKRPGYNAILQQLFPNTNNAETLDTSRTIDLLSNGFKPATSTAEINASGGTFIYAAFAEQPFKLSAAPAAEAVDTFTQAMAFLMGMTF